MNTTSDEEARATASPVVERDAKFYFDDDPMAIFLVEDKLFKVHRHFFIQGSQIFRDMFSAGDTSEGRTDEKPVVLPGVTRNEFQTLLRFFYSISFRVLGTGPIVFPGASQFTQDEKMSLLSISHRFLFDDIFHLIKSQILPTSLSVVIRIRLGDKYDMTEWLSSAYVALLDRSPDDLLAEEAKALGFKRVVCLYKAKCFMYQERMSAVKAGIGKSSSLNQSVWGQTLTSLSEVNSGSRTVPQSPPPVESMKNVTPTLEVARKFFKLK